MRLRSNKRQNRLRRKPAAPELSAGPLDARLVRLSACDNRLLRRSSPSANWRPHTVRLLDRPPAAARHFGIRRETRTVFLRTASSRFGFPGSPTRLPQSARGPPRSVNVPLEPYPFYDPLHAPSRAIRRDQTGFWTIHGVSGKYAVRVPTASASFW